MKGFLILVLTLAVGTVLLTSTPVEAKIYKCVAAGGGVSYSQSPCASEEKTSKVLQGKSVQERFDCRITRAFSKHIAEEMKAGVASDDLFSRYGGIDKMEPTSVSVVSYVYSHKGKSDASIGQIVALSGARCESGEYAQKTDCQHFPASFINAAGGCAVLKGEAVRVSEASQLEAGEALPLLLEPSVNGDVGLANPATSFDEKSLELKNYNVAKDSVAEVQTKCRTAIMSEIREVQTKMRGQMTLDERNDMNDLRDQLRDRFETC